MSIFCLNSIHIKNRKSTYHRTQCYYAESLTKAKTNIDQQWYGFKVDIKLIDFMTAKHLVLELAHPTCYKNHRSENSNNTLEKHVDAEPATGRIARQMRAQKEIANQSLIENR